LRKLVPFVPVIVRPPRSFNAGCTALLHEVDTASWPHACLFPPRSSQGCRRSGVLVRNKRSSKLSLLCGLLPPQRSYTTPGTYGTKYGTFSLHGEPTVIDVRVLILETFARRRQQNHNHVGLFAGQTGAESQHRFPTRNPQTPAKQDTVSVALRNETPRGIVRFCMDRQAQAVHCRSEFPDRTDPVCDRNHRPNIKKGGGGAAAAAACIPAR